MTQKTMEKIVALAKEILEDQVSTVIEPKKIAGDAMTSVYEIGDYVLLIFRNRLTFLRIYCIII